MKYQLWVSAYDLLTAKGNKKEFIENVAETEATGLRFFLQYAWGESSVASPYEQIATWKAGYSATPPMPFYDQAIIDTQYSEDLAHICALCAKHKLQVYACIHDGCSFKMGGWPKYLYPFFSSAPDRDFNDPSFNRFPGGFYGLDKEHGRRTVQFLQERLIEMYCMLFRNHGLKFKVEFINEDTGLGNSYQYMQMYYRWLREAFGKNGVKRKDLIASGSALGCLSHVGTYSVHGYVRPEKVPPNFSFLLGKPNNKILISGDGGFDGDGHPDAKGRKGISVEQAKDMAKVIQLYGYSGYEYLDRGMYKQDSDRMNCNDWDDAPAKKTKEVWRNE